MVIRGSAPAAAPTSLYLHVPFCFHKCHYCDFYSLVDTRDRQSSFVSRLIREIRALAPVAGRPLETVFVGGGTPSLLRPELWEELLGALAASFDFSAIKAGRAEFTVECNPETVTPELMGVLRAGGVNRISMGAQSFQPRLLKVLERWHDPESVPRALAIAKDAGISRQSLDLIFGIPTQTLAEWEKDLEAATNLGTTHLSCYALTYEPNTPLHVRRARGDVEPLDEDTEAAMFELTRAYLRAKGLVAYEVSNFAVPGDECRHNLAYWRQRDWLAAGPSASAHYAGHRWKLVPRLDDYLSFDDEGFGPIVDLELPDAGRALSERLLTGLRLAEGLDAAQFKADAESIRPGAGEKLAVAGEKLGGRGLLLEADGRWMLTESGVLVADSVILDLSLALDA